MASIDVASGRYHEREATAASRRSLAPLAGIAAMALLLAAFVVSGSSPDENAKLAKVMAYYHDHRTATAISAVLAALVTPFLIIFGTAVRQAIRRDRVSDRWGDAALAGSVLAAVGLLSAALFSFALSDGADNHYLGAAMQTLNALSAESWLLFVPGFGILAIGIGAGIVTSNALGRKLGYVVLAIGILCFVPFASFFAFVSSIIWIPVVAIKLSSVSD
jgi:hypothetical protein